MKNLLILTISSVILVGCNAGMAPEPMSQSELKSAVDKASPADQIAWIKSSPMPAAEKDAKIKAIEEKTGYKAPESNAPNTGR